jgi:hypothetical protein
MNETNELRALLRGQDGLITRAQALEHGITSARIDRNCRAGGPWQRLLRGVYLTTTGAPVRRQYLRAALLFGGETSTLSGAAAVGLAGVRNAPGWTQVLLLIPQEKRVETPEWLRVERTGRALRTRVITGLRCTTLPRAVIDACRFMTDERNVLALVAQVVQSRRCTPDQLSAELATAPRRGTAFVRKALAETGAGVHSVAEADARRAVKRAGLPDAVWNRDLYLPDGRFLARPDAYWPEFGVALEINSWAHHSSPADLARTEERRLRMQAAGITVVAVVPYELRENPERFIRNLRAVLYR